MDFFIECTISGVGNQFTGTLREALDKARTLIRGEGWRQALWVDGRKVAEVWADGEWVSSTFLNPCTG